MFNKILSIGLVVVPLLLGGPVLRETKLFTAFAAATVLCFLFLTTDRTKPFENIWATMFVAFFLVSHYFAPKLNLPLTGGVISNPWTWKAVAVGTMLYLLVVCVASKDFTSDEFSLLFKTISWTAAISAAWGILHFFHLTQFGSVDVRPLVAAQTQSYVAAGFGHPTFLGAYLAMTLPICVYVRNPFHCVLAVVGIAVTGSQAAIGATIVSLLFYYCFTRKHVCAPRVKKSAVTLFVVAVFGFIITATTVYLYVPNGKRIINDNGRFVTWAKVWDDITSPFGKPFLEENVGKKTYTGFGLGTFQYTHHLKHNDHMLQAHNEFLETVYDLGVIGGLLLVLALWWVWTKNLSFIRVFRGEEIPGRMQIALLSSFLCTILCAGASFIWHLGPHLFYSAVLVGLLHNQHVRNDKGVVYA